MKNVGFYDWQLDSSRPVSWRKIAHGGNRTPALPDIHSAIHLGIVLSGEHEAKYGWERLTFRQGEMFLTAPWEPHCSCRSTEDRKILLLNLDYELLRTHLSGCCDRFDALWKMSPHRRMAHINQNGKGKSVLCTLIADCDMPDDEPDKILFIWNSAVRFFLSILPEPGIESAGVENEYHRIQPALEQLGRRLMSVSDAAQLCNMSASHFSMLFRNLFGLSFARYERTFRLNGAADAIRRGDTLKEAAEAWGFCDKSHLARLLKQRTGG